MKVDPVHIEELAFRLWRRDVALASIPPWWLPDWPELEEATRVAYRDEAVARLLVS